MDIERLKEELEATKGVGSGTVARRLWNTLDSAVIELERIEQHLAKICKMDDKAIKQWSKKFLSQEDKIFLLEQQLAAERKRAIDEFWKELYDLTEPDERQFGVGDLNTNLDIVHAIKEKLLSKPYATEASQ